jgi:hypothetical protein
MLSAKFVNIEGIARISQRGEVNSICFGIKQLGGPSINGPQSKSVLPESLELLENVSESPCYHYRDNNPEDRYAYEIGCECQSGDKNSEAIDENAGCEHSASTQMLSSMRSI